MIKIALTATAIIALTFNLSILSNNTTVINNYIQETNKKLDTIKKSSDDIQGNTTQVDFKINKTIDRLNTLGNSTTLSDKQIISLITKILKEVQ